MSPAAEAVSSAKKRLDKLRKQLTKRFGRARGLLLLRQIQAATQDRVGTDAWIYVVDAGDVADLLPKIWAEGLAGLGAADLVEVDNYLSRTRTAHLLMLRFLKYYLEPEEYSAVETAYQLVPALSDRSLEPEYRGRLVRALYERIEGARYGHPILNQVSIGRLANSTYPEMRALEGRLTPAGRVRGPGSEAVKQLFYRSIQHDPTKLWVRSSDEPTEVFAEIAHRLLEKGAPTPYLDVYAAARAERVRDAAVDAFLRSYGQYESESHRPVIGWGYVRLRRRAKP